MIEGAWPGAAAVAEVLWSEQAGRQWSEAEARLKMFRCVLAERGVAAAPVSGVQAFGSCDH